MGGFAHLGFLHVLQQYQRLNCVDTWVGCSIGASVCLLCALGYTPKDIYERCQCLDENIFTFKATGDLLSSKGMDDGEYIKAFLYDAIMGAGLAPSLTFAELKKSKGRRLIVCATDVKSCTPVYFTPETHGDVPVVQAVRASMGVPILLTPTVRLFCKRQEMLSDGGIMDNFPIKFALSDFGARYGTSNAVLSVIGCNLVSPPTKEIADLKQFLFAVWACIRRQHADDSPCTVNVEVSDWESFNFSASESTRKRLFDSGVQATQVYLQSIHARARPALERRRSV